MSMQSEVPLVLIHGFAGNLALWDGLIDALQPRPIIRYDLRGFGKSSLLKAGASHSGDLKALLDELGIESCHLMGCSMGGSIAMNFALDFPGIVQKLILVSPGLTAWEWSDAWQEHWQDIVRCARSGDMPSARELWVQHPLFASTKRAGMFDTLRNSIDDYSGIHWMRDDLEGDAFPDVERLHMMEAATHLVSGRWDIDEFRLISDIICGAIPDCTRTDIDAGHMIPLEKPGLLAEIVRSHLA